MKNWLVVLDDTAWASYAFNYATKQARRGDTLYLMQLLETSSLTSHLDRVERPTGRESVRGMRVLVYYAKRAEQLGLRYVLLKGASRKPGDLIIRAVEDEEINCVVVGEFSKGGIGAFMTGSTASRILAKANCTVIVLKRPYGETEEEANERARILSEDEDTALERERRDREKETTPERNRRLREEQAKSIKKAEKQQRREEEERERIRRQKERELEELEERERRRREEGERQMEWSEEGRVERHKHHKVPKEEKMREKERHRREKEELHRRRRELEEMERREKERHKKHKEEVAREKERQRKKREVEERRRQERELEKERERIREEERSRREREFEKGQVEGRKEGREEERTRTKQEEVGRTRKIVEEELEEARRREKREKKRLEQLERETPRTGTSEKHEKTPKGERYRSYEPGTQRGVESERSGERPTGSERGVGERSPGGLRSIGGERGVGERVGKYESEVGVGEQGGRFEGQRGALGESITSYGGAGSRAQKPGRTTETGGGFREGGEYKSSERGKELSPSQKRATERGKDEEGMSVYSFGRGQGREESPGAGDWYEREEPQTTGFGGRTEGPSASTGQGGAVSGDTRRVAASPIAPSGTETSGFVQTGGKEKTVFPIPEVGSATPGTTFGASSAIPGTMFGSGTPWAASTTSSTPEFGSSSSARTGSGGTSALQSGGISGTMQEKGQDLGKVAKPALEQGTQVTQGTSTPTTTTMGEGKKPVGSEEGRIAESKNIPE